MAECASDESLDDTEVKELTPLDTVGYYRPHMYTSDDMSMGCEGWSDDDWADYETGSPLFGMSIVSDKVELGVPSYDTDMSRGDELSSGGSKSASIYMADS